MIYVAGAVDSACSQKCAASAPARDFGHILLYSGTIFASGTVKSRLRDLPKNTPNSGTRFFNFWTIWRPLLGLKIAKKSKKSTGSRQSSKKNCIFFFLSAVGARASIFTFFRSIFAVFIGFATPPKRKPLLPPGSPSPGTPKTDLVKSTAKGK